MTSMTEKISTYFGESFARRFRSRNWRFYSIKVRKLRASEWERKTAFCWRVPGWMSIACVDLARELKAGITKYVVFTQPTKLASRVESWLILGKVKVKEGGRSLTCSFHLHLHNNCQMSTSAFSPLLPPPRLHCVQSVMWFTVWWLRLCFLVGSPKTRHVEERSATKGPSHTNGGLLVGPTFTKARKLQRLT